MKKNIILTIMAILGLVSCNESQVNKPYIKVFDNYKPIYTADEISSKFDSALLEKNDKGFEKIFIEWNKLVKPNTKDFINQNDVFSAIFSIYMEFYKPNNIDALGIKLSRNIISSKNNYVIVQNQIQYSVISFDSIDDIDINTIKTDTINNFRPPVNVDSGKVLYLTQEYYEALLKYLYGDSDNYDAREKQIMYYEKISPFITLHRSHWGGYRCIVTYPYITLILFDNTLTKAKIYFNVWFDKAETLMEKADGKWAIKESKVVSSWIE